MLLNLSPMNQERGEKIPEGDNIDQHPEFEIDKYAQQDEMPDYHEPCPVTHLLSFLVPLWEQGIPEKEVDISISKKMRKIRFHDPPEILIVKRK